VTTQRPPAPTASVQNANENAARSLYLAAIIGALAAPGALVGALLIAPLWKRLRPALTPRAVIAVAAVLVAVRLPTLSPGWLVPLFVDGITGAHTPVPFTPRIQHSVLTELLFGPALLVALQAARGMHTQTALGRVKAEREMNVRRSNAMRLGWKSDSVGPPPDSPEWNDPPGKIRLGIDESLRMFDLDVSEIAQHIAVPGASGSGKTETLMRLARGALGNGYGVALIDCKGSGLTPRITKLAADVGAPLHIVDPDNPSTVGYDPCTGDAAHIANKIVGAFTFSDSAEIFKQVAMEVVPVIVRALQATGQTPSLRTIYDALGKGGLQRLGRTPGAEEYEDILRSLDESGGVGASGYAGLQRRLGALMQGKFGPLFEQQPALAWQDVTAQQTVTYFSLSATAAGEDVELFGRVIIQDLKQFCDARMRMIERGQNVRPYLVIIDEYAALREAQQIVDLLLQARAARMPIVVASQFIPEERLIRIPILQSGVLICHRLGAEDSEIVAAEFGTRAMPRVTAQVDYETGESAKGSIRTVQEFNMHPDVLRELQPGAAAVYARRTMRRSVVHVHMDT
jgi:hypothetical protein